MFNVTRKCKACGQLIEDSNARKCPGCGKPLGKNMKFIYERRCEHCGEIVDEKYMEIMCPHCGHKFATEGYGNPTF